MLENISFISEMYCNDLTRCSARKWCLFIFLVLIQILHANGQRHEDPHGIIYDEGDGCIVNGAPGNCTLITSCPEVLRDVVFKRPQTCGFLGSTPIVCCPKAQKNETLQVNNRSPFQDEVGKKAKEKCVEYSSYVYEWVLPENETDPEKKVRVNRCGHVASALIIGYDATTLGEFPHMALLGKKLPDGTREWFGGGALISEEFVMTVAANTYSRDGELRWVRLGEYSINIDDESEVQDFSIEEIIRHPDYHHPTKYNDIALLRLDRRAFLNKFVIPACLHTQFDVQQKSAMVTGWEYGQVRNGEPRLDLGKISLEIFTSEECNATYVNASHRSLRYGISESMLCAGLRSLHEGTCEGDGGGPLQVYLKTPYCMYDVIGLQSFGKGCSTPGIPLVYTRVSHYVGWIESVVWPN